MERLLKTCIKINADIKFLTFCLQNQLLPKFVNFKLYDVSAQHEKSTIKFKTQLLDRELKKKKEELLSHRRLLGMDLVYFKSNSRGLYFYSTVRLLQRISAQYDSDITLTHTRKLEKLYNGDIVLPVQQDNIINLSSYTLTENERSILNKGLNYSISKKPNYINRKIEVEKLFYNIDKHARQDHLTISNVDDFKIELKNFAIKKRRYVNTASTRDMQTIKGLQQNFDIVIQKPDKGGGVVIMDKSFYNDGLTSLISDETKFEPCSDAHNENLKKKINNLANTFKNNNELLFKRLSRVGAYNSGHLYGLPKIHKNATNPPLRPVISMSGTVTHDIAQYINSIIREYLNNKFIVRSSDELLLQLKTLKVEPEHQVCSLDVESLFTNVPVQQTIDIIMQSVYYHESIPPPEMPEAVMRQLLHMCTTETPFQHNGSLYVQKDGVSIGSPLGPTFADFYMSALENHMMSQNLISNPLFFVRYVDDILAIFKSKSHVNYFIRRLHNNSVLKFTTELMDGNCFNFLDVKLTLENRNFNTSVYIKPTDKGIYSHFSSHTLNSYKISVIKTLFFRALKLSSSWREFDNESRRLKQILVNNGYPLTLIDKVLNRTVNKYFTTSNDIAHDFNDINFYIQLDNINTFQNDSKQLKNIVKYYVKANHNYSININAYFLPSKISAFFSTRPSKPVESRSGVVYLFECPQESCNASYIGYTTNTLLTRCKQHKYSPSKIHAHFIDDHDMIPPHHNSFINCFKILFSSHNNIDIKIAESLYIKQFKPFINVKYNEAFSLLKLF